MFSAQSFNEIPNLIDNLKFRLNNGSDEIREHSIQLRTEVMLETELAIQKIQNRSDELIKIIDKYEQNTIANFETEKTKYTNSKEFIDELEIFHKTSLERSRNFETQNIELEIDEDKSFMDTLDERYRRENNSLETLIFDRKLMFCPNGKLGENLLGNFQLRKKEYEDSIDIKKFELLSLKDMFLDVMIVNGLAPFIKMDIYEDGKIAVIYMDYSKKIRISIIDQNGTMLTSFDIDCECENINQFKITNKNFIVISFECKDLCENAVIIDSKFELVKYFQIRHQKSIDISDHGIYCLDYNGKITILDKELTLMKVVQIDNRSKEPKDMPIYQKITYKFNKFYCMHYRSIDIVNENSGVILNSIDIRAESIKFDWQGNILALSSQLPEVYVYSSDGTFIKRISIDNGTFYRASPADFCIDKNGKFFIFDCYSFNIYLEKQTFKMVEKI